VSVSIECWRKLFIVQKIKQMQQLIPGTSKFWSVNQDDCIFYN
jgi:hypothetical protein